MADITVTAANVISGTYAVFVHGTAGATITAGQVVYLDTSANTYKLCDVDLSAAAAVIAGIATHGASSGQPLKVQVAGNINPGGTVGVGTVYVGSGNAGGIAPHSDMAQNDYAGIIGIGTTTSNIKLGILNSGVLVP